MTTVGLPADPRGRERSQRMVRTPNPNRPRRALPGVEQLESREVPTVFVNPSVLNLKTVNHGKGTLTVRVISDTQAAKDLLSAGGPVTVSVLKADGTTASLGTPERTVTQDIT